MTFGFGELSEWNAEIVTVLLKKINPNIQLYYEWHTFIPGLQPLKIVGIPTHLPTMTTILMNGMLALTLMVIGRKSKYKSNPFMIYLTIMMGIHLVTAVFFLFVGKLFPYTAAEYSELYMKQQMSTWIFFIILGGTVIGILGSGTVWIRIVTFLGIMTYSFCFGILRCVIFLSVLYQYSIIYMTLFFFALGPLYDFLYLVCIYSIYMNKIVTIYEEKTKQEEWIWP